MQNSLIRFVILSLLGAQPAGARGERPDFEKHFRGLDACFILHDLKTDRPVLEFNEKRCADPQAPCSTFKVPLALMAFDRNVVQDAATSFKWDGTEYSIKAWNKDQTTESWLRDSAVWVSQRITPKLGQETVQRYLDGFEYGNRDMSSGLTHFWLTRGPGSTAVPDPSLKITPREQIQFLTRMWKGQLGVSRRALAETRKLLFLEESPNGYRLHGKTGSGFIGPERDLRLGWFIAQIEKGEEQYVAVISTSETEKKESAGTYAGLEAREKMKLILAEMGLW